MAYPTRLTIASGRNVYEGDPGEDRGAGRRVSVSVTYQLEREDTDLLHLTALKAREVEQAQAAVWRQVNGEQTELWTDGRMDEGMDGAVPTAGPPPTDDDRFWGGPGDPEADRDEGQDGDPDWPGDEAVFYHGAGTAHGGDHGGNGHDRPGDTRPGHGGPQADGSGRAPLPITKPQRLALEAQARRLGMSDVALAQVIRERFGKSSFTPRFAASLLSKAEANVLLRALSEQEWEAGRQAQEGVRPAVPA